MYLMDLTSRDVIFIFVIMIRKITGLHPGSLLVKIQKIIKVNAVTEQDTPEFVQTIQAFIQKHFTMYRWKENTRSGV